VIADDDTIQYLSRFRTRYHEAVRAGAADPHQTAAIATLRECGLPMFLTAAAVTTGFLTLVFSQFTGLANLGLLMGASLLTAVFADLFLSPLLLMTIKPKLHRRR
jgi:predicted RND superfamily exporter protein